MNRTTLTRLAVVTLVLVAAFGAVGGVSAQNDTLNETAPYYDGAEKPDTSGWFDGIDTEGMCRRLRPNIVLGGVPAFWEDHLFADRDSRVRFSIGDAELLGVNPCQRCVVPSRDPDTGDEIEGFNQTFIEQRRATMPDWSGGDWFNHDFRLMVNTAVPEASWVETIAVGDELTVGETVPADETPVPAE